MQDRTCTSCGETKPWRAFWGKNREVEPTCSACRRKEYDRRRKRKAYNEQKQEQVRGIIRAARQKQEQIDKTLTAAVREINKKLSQIKHKINTYSDKIIYGSGSSRTEKALRYQEHLRDYYEEIKELLMEDAANGIERPLEYYLTNTFLLNKHGFPCVVKDADPRSE